MDAKPYVFFYWQQVYSASYLPLHSIFDSVLKNNIQTGQVLFTGKGLHLHDIPVSAQKTLTIRTRTKEKARLRWNGGGRGP